MGFKLLELFTEFSSRPHGGDFDFGGPPARQITDILNAIFFEVEEANHDLLAGLESDDEAIEKLTHGGKALLVSIGLSGEVFLENIRLGLTKIRVGNERAGLLPAQPVVAGIDGEAGDPVGERLSPGKLVEFEKNLGEGFLGEIVVIGPTAHLATDDADDEWIELANQFRPRLLVTGPDAGEQFGSEGDRLIHDGLGRKRSRSGYRRQ